jgi:hypothetical protein
MMAAADRAVPIPVTNTRSPFSGSKYKIAIAQKRIDLGKIAALFPKLKLTGSIAFVLTDFK